MKLKDIPKVTRCLALMAKMVNIHIHSTAVKLFFLILKAGVKEFEDITIELPEEENNEDNLIEEAF